jgi:hypothetical protein
MANWAGNTMLNKTYIAGRQPIFNLNNTGLKLRWSSCYTKRDNGVSRSFNLGTGMTEKN